MLTQPLPSITNNFHFRASIYKILEPPLLNLNSRSGTPADFVLADDNPHIPPSLSIPDDPSSPTSPPISTSTAFSAHPPSPQYHYPIEQVNPLPPLNRHNIGTAVRGGIRTRSTPQAELRPRRTADQVLGRRRRDSTVDEREQPDIRPSPGDSYNFANSDSEHRRKRNRQMPSMISDGQSNNSNGNPKPFSNGAEASSSHKAAPSNSANGAHFPSIAMNGSSTNGHSAVRQVSTYFGHDREEVTRILIQALNDLGYNGAAGTLSQESGYDLESTAVAAFRNAVLQGEWTEAEELLFGGSTEEGGASIHVNGLILRDGVDKNFMRFWIRQQKFLELLEQKDMGRAINVLRSELTPLYQDTAKLHFLSR